MVEQEHQSITASMSTYRIDIINSGYINHNDTALFKDYSPDNITYDIICGDEQVKLHIRDLQKNIHPKEDDENNDTFSEITTEDTNKEDTPKELSLAEGLMVVFNVKDKSSFEHVDGIIQEYKSLTNCSGDGYGATIGQTTPAARISSPMCPIEVIIVAGNVDRDEDDWAVTREDFMRLAQKHDIKDVYEVGEDLRESIYEILTEFGTTVHQKSNAFKELVSEGTGYCRSSSSWRCLGDETISGHDMRRLMNAESGDYSFTDLESQALLPRNGDRRISSSSARSIITQCFGNGPFARVYPFLMIVFAALMSVAVYLDHGDQPTSHEIFRMKNRLKEFKWPFHDPQENLLPSSHVSARLNETPVGMKSAQSLSSNSSVLLSEACIFMPPTETGHIADEPCNIDYVNVEVTATNGSWPSGFSWSLYRKNFDGNGTQSKKLDLFVTKDSFSDIEEATVSCNRFITQMCLNGEYVAYAQSSVMPGLTPVEMRVCDDSVPVGNALEFKVAESTKGCVEQGFVKSQVSPPFEGVDKTPTKLKFISPTPVAGGAMLDYDKKDSGKIHRVACVGDSITRGVGSSNINMSYPSRLGSELGGKYLVGNFGHDGAYINMHHTANTALNEQDLSYIRLSEYEKALDFNPNVVIIMFGTNDSKQNVWDSESFKAGLETIVRRFKALESKPVIYLMIPPTVEDSYYSRLYLIQTETLKEEVPKIVREVAREVDVHLIDLRELYDMSKGLVSRDRIHPSDEGYRVMTDYIHNHLKKSKLY